MQKVKIDTGNLCLLCLKDHVSIKNELEDEDGEEEKQSLMKFSKLLARLLGLKYNLQVKLCTDCALLTNMISETFQELEIAKIKLHWRLQSLCDIIKNAESVPSRRNMFRERVKHSVRKSARRLKTDILLKSMEELESMKPRVIIPKFDGEQRIVKQFSSYPGDEDNLLMLSLIGCVVSFWLVISLSALNPEDTITYAKYQKINAITTNTCNCNMIDELEGKECAIQISNIQSLSYCDPPEELNPASLPLTILSPPKSIEVIVIDDEPSSEESSVPAGATLTTTAKKNDTIAEVPPPISFDQTPKSSEEVIVINEESSVGVPSQPPLIVTTAGTNDTIALSSLTLSFYQTSKSSTEEVIVIDEPISGESIVPSEAPLPSTISTEKNDTIEGVPLPIPLDQTPKSTEEVSVSDPVPVQELLTTAIVEVNKDQDSPTEVLRHNDPEADEYVSIDESILSAIPSGSCGISLTRLEDASKLQNEEENAYTTTRAQDEAPKLDSQGSLLHSILDQSPSPAKRMRVLSKEVIDDTITKFVIEKRLTKKQETSGKKPDASSSPNASALESEAPFNEPEPEGVSSAQPQRITLLSIKDEPLSPLPTVDMTDSDASTVCSDPPSPEEPPVSETPPPEFLQGLDLTLKRKNDNCRVEKPDLKILIDNFMKNFAKRKKLMRPVSPKPLSSTYCPYLICETCKVQYESRAKLEKHRVVKHNTRAYVKCPLCSKMFDCYGSLEEHRSLNKGCDVMEDTKQLEMKDMARPIFPFIERASIKGNIFCPHEHCYEVFSSETLLDVHMKSHGDFPCQFCPQKFGKASELALHECESHRNSLLKQKRKIGEFSCARCHFYGRRENEYICHFIEYHLNITGGTGNGAPHHYNDSPCAFKIIKY